MLPEAQDRVVVVLVRARNPSNIGASARAMHDLGFAHLRIVNEFPVPFAAAKSAVDASSVLNAAQEFSTVAEAIADCTLVFGTTAVGERVLEHPLHLLAEAAAIVQGRLRIPGEKIALLFGSEKTGLSNDELSHCHALLTIPMNIRGGDRHLSMNLGQAVAVILYGLSHVDGPGLKPLEVDELSRGAEAPRFNPKDEDIAEDQDLCGSVGGPAPSGDIERLTSLLRDVLDTSGYTRRHPANTRQPVLRRLVRRMGLSDADAAVWTGILRQIGHALDRTER